MSRAARTHRALERQLPSVVAALSRSVHGGATLLLAIEEVVPGVDAPAHGDLRDLVRSVGRGVAMDAALGAWGSRRRSASVDLIVAACRFGHAEGGDLAAALDGAAVSLLDRVELADEARALSSQARSSATVLVALPVLGAVGFSMLEPAVATTLLTTVPGWCCLVVGGSLDALGAWVLSRMVRSALA